MSTLYAEFAPCELCESSDQEVVNGVLECCSCRMALAVVDADHAQNPDTFRGYTVDLTSGDVELAVEIKKED